MLHLREGADYFVHEPQILGAHVSAAFARRSALDGASLDGGQWFAGVFVAMFVCVLAPAGIAIAIRSAQAAMAGAQGKKDEARARAVVEARFVKLGKVFDPRQLPNRRVPPKVTAPPRGIVVSKNMNPEQIQLPDAAVPAQAIPDKMVRNLFHRIEAFAELEQQREMEGHPEGIDEGTETEARAGDVYRGQLYIFFRRGWSVPTVLNPDEIRGLRTTVTIAVAEDGRLENVRIRHESGTPLFDQSVVDNIENLIRSGASIPEPPPEVAAEFLGKSLDINFNGRDAR